VILTSSAALRSTSVTSVIDFKHQQENSSFRSKNYVTDKVLQVKKKGKAVPLLAM
jgi:hypothetical protein